MSLNQRVVRSYRDILKTTKKVFQHDAPTILAARNQIRSEFYRLENEKDNEKIEQALSYCHEVKETLVKNVVQATPLDSENDPYAYKVHIANDTEINDNETIRQKMKAKNRQLNNGSVKKCCGSN
ncbi:hypothetical protein CONCODRAFT_86055 [Conidiobolus coronatus NRRL 28638]|uniref:Mitochondrial zinc maintenance protein 1, mitochondrial n=1 Tax=Conidiobolus coronatus (strain ATCC 28846 / CBS 209.66 / NRRL 28638) TaxID=796925 RepID=A0A137P2L3_CONC2|nr:hypothetical protein CONCODRAFT_86055 [Conidiobolus coronatus NRRL 28638]|eukprot:KXN69198.1 hypothetical protein CONCODRAFT_86055 [Conidiobolus coronatus NRRL 28638]